MATSNPSTKKPKMTRGQSTPAGSAGITPTKTKAAGSGRSSARAKLEASRKKAAENKEQTDRKHAEDEAKKRKAEEEKEEAAKAAEAIQLEKQKQDWLRAKSAAKEKQQRDVDDTANGGELRKSGDEPIEVDGDDEEMEDHQLASLMGNDVTTPTRPSKVNDEDRTPLRTSRTKSGGEDAAAPASTGLEWFERLEMSDPDPHVSETFIFATCKLPDGLPPTDYAMQLPIYTASILEQLRLSDNSCGLINSHSKFETELVYYEHQIPSEYGQLAYLISLETKMNRPQQRLQFSFKMGHTWDASDLVAQANAGLSASSYFRGTAQIDAVFATSDIDCSGARFLPFGFSGVGDHRGIVVDIPFQSLIGSQVHKIVRPAARRLNTDIPGCLEAYNKNLREQLQAKGAPQLLRELYSKSRVLTDDQFDQRKEALDRARSQSMARAELKCRKLRLGAVDFSPTVNVWAKRLEVWELVRRLRRGGKVSTTTIRRRAKAAQVDHPLRATEEEADARRRECEAQYLAEKCNAPELRRRFLSGLVATAEEKGDSARAKQISQLLAKERSRRQWRDIAIATGKRQAGSVSKVQEETDAGTRDHVDRDSVEDAIMSENTKRFLLTYSAHGSQFLRGQLLQDVGFLADTAGAESILNGTYVPPAEADEYT